MRGPKASVKVPMEMRAKMAPHTLATLAPLTPLRVRLRSCRMTAQCNKDQRCQLGGMLSDRASGPDLPICDIMFGPPHATICRCSSPQCI